MTIMQVVDEAPTCIQNDQRVLHVLTGNPCDNLYVVWDTDEVPADELSEELGRAMRRRFGKRGSGMIRGWEDCTHWYDWTTM